VTNDFPPRAGGIQSYLDDLTRWLPPDRLVVYAPQPESSVGSPNEFDAAAEYEVIRHPRSLLLPTPGVARRAKQIMHSHACQAVWFGAAAPLALLAEPLRKAGAERIVASTHGHEVGWSMLPGGRSVLRRIGGAADAVTFVSKYTRGRISGAFGPFAGLEYLPSGVNTARFRPDEGARTAVRRRHGLGQRPTVLCVSRLVPRKGQDMLVRSLPELRSRVPGTTLLLVGEGPYRARLERLAAELGVAEHVVFAGAVSAEELPAYYNAGDVFAMPVRTRGRGMDVEGLGIVYLEASATGLPVVAGNSGGAPETVRDELTGRVVDGRNPAQLTDTLTSLLSDPVRAAGMGQAGREWILGHWRWDIVANRLAMLLAGDITPG